MLWLGRGGLRFAPAFAGQRDAMGIVHQTVEDGVGQRWIAEHFKLPLTSNELFLPLPLRIRVTRCMASG